MENKNFKSYKDYVKLQISKPFKNKQKGLSWEYNNIRNVKSNWIQEVSNYVNLQSIKHCLVLGGRWGGDVLHLREGGCQGKITAIDLHDPPLSEYVIFGDAHDLSFLNTPIDLVYAHHVFEHFFKPSVVIDQIKQYSDNPLYVACVLPTFEKKDKYDAQDEFNSPQEFIDIFAFKNFECIMYNEKVLPKKKKSTHFFIFKLMD